MALGAVAWGGVGCMGEWKVGQKRAESGKSFAIYSQQSITFKSKPGPAQGRGELPYKKDRVLVENFERTPKR